MTLKSMPLVVPKSCAYSMAMASSGVLPVRSPNPSTVVLTEQQP
jgi:hypothetical protein